MFIYLPITIYLLKLRDESSGVYVETDLTVFLILEMDVNQIKLDSDKDGLTDLFEEKLFLNPFLSVQNRVFP